jgi:branched-chain amino acid transport system permease protein
VVKRLLGDFRWGILPVPGRVLAVIFFVVLFLFPLITQALVGKNSGGIMFTFTLTCVYAIFAVSWDLLSGYSGQVSFGHALCFGSGAYISAILYLHLHWPPAATIPIATVGAALVGVVTCFPALRLRAPYISLLTMALPIILASVIKELPREWAGGKYGIAHIPPLAPTSTGTYYICLIVMAASVLIMWKLTDAGSRYIRTGLIFHAIREDEIAARATGINTIRYKILAFAISGFFAGLAGALIAHVANGASPDHFSLVMSFNAIIWVVFGGIVSIYGAVVGAFTLSPLMDFLSAQQPAIASYRTLIVTVLIIVILLFMPEGVAVWIRNKIERECPRCKLGNVAWRKECRACGAPLH